MSSIRDSLVALDTNEYIFAVRRVAAYPACEELLYDRMPQLRVYLPLQVFLELQRNLDSVEIRGVFRALAKAKELQWDLAPASPDLLSRWLESGARAGDAAIAAHLEKAEVPYLISENRHFLAELPELPFAVLSASAGIQLLS